MARKFVHLHVHTEYSLLDGLPKIKDLIRYVKDDGMDTLAITDHGAMYGAIEFYEEARKQGVNPIVGMEAYTTNIDHKKRPERGKFKNFHLLLLAKNEEGYKNLMKLTSIAHLEGYYYRPRFNREILAKYSKGLIVTSACAQGEIAQAIIEGDLEKAKKIAKWFYDVFGQDYYLEIQRHRYASFLDEINNPDLKREISMMAENEKVINEGVVKLSRELGIPIVATNDSHYIKKEDATAQDALVCIATGKNVSDIKRLRFIDTPSFHVAKQEEMAELFADLPEALENTIKISEKCDLKISTLGKWFFPNFPLPKGYTAEKYLRKIVYDRLETRIKKITKEVKDRIEYELDVIISKGYAPYFLIVMDMVNWAQKRGIITNTRGSAAGSLVSFVLGITTVNPLTYYLPFERFLNPARPSPPDIDLDVSDSRREEVIEYIIKKYGKDKVAQICTFGRMLSRAAVRDVARVLGYPYETGDRIAKLIPPPQQGFPISIPKALEQTEELRRVYTTDPDARKILDLAKQIEGNARHVSVHAAALVVAPSVLTDFTPIQKEPSGEKIITQYEMRACESVGLIKFDILGIRNLSILSSAIEIVKKTRGEKIDLQKIPLDDKKTFEMLSRGETMGVFQLSGAGMTRFLKELKPTRIEDLMAMVALYRPGPMAVIPEYIRRKRNPKLVKYLDPRMKKFLDKSYGLIVYQDDLLFCAIELAGYSWEEADKFRKAVGKKIPEEMAAQRKKFIKGVIKNGQTKEFAEKLWELFEPFQSYGFNKAHAASYGLVAYQTAYMKANYPVEYMAALLSAESGDSEKVSAAVSECKRMGIKVLPPDINESGFGFKIVEDSESLDGRAIRFGLGAIKNVGKAAVKAILSARKNGEFVSFADFLGRVDNQKVNKKVIESLVKVGAMQKFGSRAALLASIDEIRTWVGKSNAAKGQQGLFSQDDFREGGELQTGALVRADIPEFSEEELQNLERQLLGFSISAKSVHELIEPLIHHATHRINEIETEDLVGQMVKIAAVVSEVRVVVAKRSGQEMAFVKISDDTGSIDVVVFPKIFSTTRNIWVDHQPILATGRVDFREEEPSLVLESVETEETISDNKHVFIKIPKTVSPSDLKKLKRIFLENPGEYAATLVFEGNHSDKISLDVKINWNETLARLIQEVLEGSAS